MDHLDYEDAVEHLTRLTGKPVWVGIWQKGIGNVASFAAVLEEPTGPGFWDAVGSGLEPNRETFHKALVDRQEGYDRVVLRLRFRGGVQVSVWERDDDDGA